MTKRLNKKAAVLAVAGTFLLCAVGTATVTGAAFTDTAAITADLATGTLDIKVDDKDGTANLTLSHTNLAPGETSTTTFTLKNTGSIPARIDGSTPSTGVLAKHLDATVRAGSQTLYTGKLSALTFADLTLSPSSSQTITIALTLPPTTSNDLQGKTETFTVDLVAAQQ